MTRTSNDPDGAETVISSERWTDANHPEVSALIDRARAGDEAALASLYERYRARLHRMVEVRLDRRLHGRVDVSDVLQDAYVNLANKLDGYRSRGDLPFFVWLRLVTAECLVDVHRHHLGVAKRDADVEVALHRGPMPVTDSYSLAAQLLGQQTSASQRLMRAEAQIELQDALNRLDPLDREILVLRHFEELSNIEAAQTLDIAESAASSRYFRAVKRLRKFFDPGE